MDKIVYISGKVENGKIATEITDQKIADLIASKKIVIIKNLFTAQQMLELRTSVFEWGKTTPLATTDDFRSNYHSRKAKVSNIQQSPHVFHDYNFNNFSKLPDSLNKKMFSVFDSLRIFYNSLTHNTAELGVIKNKHYFHPQLIQYPEGGGFFGRHNHNLLPQKIGFILALSKFGTDYKAGGTCFEIDNELVSLEGLHDIGDLCLWHYDLDHWVSQSPLNNWFNWDSDKGRWVATLAYFNPF
ncbi:MAG: hypothetical protein H7239_11690 [Flavobacterium sp.]|nr:hypothetical protein [Flavobacterium sp.]